MQVLEGVSWKRFGQDVRCNRCGMTVDNLDDDFLDQVRHQIVSHADVLGAYIHFLNLK